MQNSVLNGAIDVKTIACWIAFFATSVYGHVALKLAVSDARSTSTAGILRSGVSGWGISAYIAWGLSCFCWMLVLVRSDLLKASSVSALSYVLICAAAVVFLGDSVTWPRLLGVVLITSGIVLIK